jgi:hypothetical protein
VILLGSVQIQTRYVSADKAVEQENRGVYESVCVCVCACARVILRGFWSTINLEMGLSLAMAAELVITRVQFHFVVFFKSLRFILHTPYPLIAYCLIS